MIIQSSTFKAPQDDFRDSVRYIESSSTKIEKIVLEAGFIIDPVSFYVNKTWSSELVQIYYSSNTINQLNTMLHQDKSFWVIRSHSQDSNNTIYTWLNSNHWIDKSIGTNGVKEFNGVTVFRASMNATI